MAGPTRTPADAATACLGKGGTSTGVNLFPGSDDDGWIVPPPVRLRDGTTMQLYKDGEALHAAYRAIEAARERVLLEIYIFQSDGTGRAFAELLSRRAREGLDVRVVFDSFGSIRSESALFDGMRAAGVAVREFHPLKPWRARHAWKPFLRDHRKLLVVDQRLAVLGGQNLGNEYGSSWVSGEPHCDAWRDTAVGLDGPSAAVLAEVFLATWGYVEHGGPIRRAQVIRGVEPYAEEAGGSRTDESLAVIASTPTPRSRVLPLLQDLLRGARTSIDLTMAYFAPPDELVERLCRSAREGVRVRLMLPGRSDVALLTTAARAFYERLMAARVEVFERQHAVLHAKALCVDGRVSVVGSTNLDHRSFQYNCELSVSIRSEEFGAQVTELFEHDVRFARRISLDEWRHRPRRDRIVQALVGSARKLL
jgi:cardiolipin synthase